MADNQARSASSIFSEIELLQLIIHNLGEGVVVADAEGNFVIWNAEAERIMGKGMTEAPIEHWAEEYGVFTADTKKPIPADQTVLARALRGERVDGFEEFIRNPGVPEGVYIKVTGRPIRDLKGRLLGGVTVIRDVTAERRAQEGLRRLAAIVTSSADGIMALAPDGRIAECNHSAAQMLGATDRELRGKPAASLAREPGRADFAKRLEEAAAGKFSGSLVVDFERRDKASFCGAVTLAPIRLPGGPVIGLSMMMRDVTEKRRLDRLRDELLAVASHEMRGPAASVQLSLDMLKEDLSRAGGAESSLKIVDTASRACERLVNLLDECLDAERLRPGRAPALKLEPRDVVAVLREAVELARPDAARRRISLETKGLFGEAIAKLEPGRLLQAVGNLVGNALKFSPEGSTVVVGLERLPKRLRLYVADSGPGISEKLRPRLFERFARPRTPQTENVEGAGLGLSIAKEIVERHGGGIGFDSTPGQGTTFYIDLDEAA